MSPPTTSGATRTWPLPTGHATSSRTISQTAAVPDALAVLIEANWQLGLHEAANDSLKVLALNFPDYHAFDASGQLVLQNVVNSRERSWLNMVTFGLLGRPDAPPPLTIRQG